MPGHGARRGRRGWGALVGAHTPRGFCLVSEKQSGARRLLTKVFGLPCPFSLLESAEWGLPGSAVCLFLLMMPPEALIPLPLAQQEVAAAQRPLSHHTGQGAWAACEPGWLH